MVSVGPSPFERCREQLHLLLSSPPLAMKPPSSFLPQRNAIASEKVQISSASLNDKRNNNNTYHSSLLLSTFTESLRNPRHSIRWTFLLGLLLTLISECVFHYQNHSHHHRDTHDYEFALQRAWLVSIVISVPILLDMCCAWFVEEVNDSTDSDLVRDMSMRLVLLPNIFMYFGLLSPHLENLKVVLQFLFVFQLALYRMYQIAATDKLPVYCSFLPISRNITVVYVAVFLYNLSLHNVIGGREALGVVFAVLLFGAQLHCVYTTKAWLSVSMRLRALAESERGVFFGVQTVVWFSLSVGLMNLVASFVLPTSSLFFARTQYSCVFFEWCFILGLLFVNALRNMNVRKSEVALARRLNFNQKMTGAISHEIRTPLSTAFMALDLLVSSLRSPTLSVAQEERESLLEVVGMVREGCDLSLGILNELLTFEKLGSGMMQLEAKLTPLLPHIEGNADIFRIAAQQKNITLKTDLSAEQQAAMGDFWVYADEHKLGQVARNLLSNAIKFTPSGGTVSFSVEVHADTGLNSYDGLEKNALGGSFHCEYVCRPISRCFKAIRHYVLGNPQVESLDNNGNQANHGHNHSENDVNVCWGCVESARRNLCGVARDKTDFTATHTTHLDKPGVSVVFQQLPGMKPYGFARIAVTDTGPGIDEADIPKLFQEYVQINPGELQKGQGSGLGLSICKSIVALHGGAVWVESEGKGCGSTFFVALPLYTRNTPAGMSSLSISLPIQSVISASSSVHGSVKGAAFPLSTPFTSPRAEENNASPMVSMTMPLPMSGRRLHSRESGRSRSKLRPADAMSLLSLSAKSAALLPERSLKDNVNVSVYTNTEKDRDRDVSLSRLRTPFPQVTPSRTENKPDSDVSARPSLRFLVVDDSCANRKLLCHLLTRDGQRCVEADDGRTAVEYIRRYATADHSQDQGVDVILMDYIMTHMHGPDAAQRIRSLGFTGPLIGVTGLMDEECNAFIAAGADLVLCKPVTVQGIWNALNSLNLQSYND